MTNNETRKLLARVNAFYPNWKIDDPEETVGAWFSVLKEYSLEECDKALNDYVKGDITGYAPAVSKLIAQIKKNRRKTGTDWDALARELMD